MTTKKLFLTVFAVVMTFCVAANPVDVNRARRVGAAYLNAMGRHDVSALQEVKTSFSEFYVFNAGETGFVLVAADDCVRPILGYSLTGSFRADEMPTNVQGWLEDYESGIAAVKQAVQQAKKEGKPNSGMANAVVAEWQQLASGQVPEPQVLTSVSPLLATTWNQSPLYNDMCPYDSVYGQRVVTGCVATATAQIMKYWNHPATGYGSHSYTAQNSHISYGVQSANFGNTNYAWSTMPNALTSTSSQAEIDAVALLMYHVGVALEMGYNVSSQGGSGAYNYSWDGNPRPSSQFALVEYFKYSPDIAMVPRSGTDEATYCAILRGELDQSRPILYSGRSNTGGHSFVCDGYDVYNYFHINWGWGGYCDGFYIMGALNPAPGGTGGNSTSTYNNSNVVLIGIRPNANFGTGGTVTVNTTGGNATCTATGSGTYAFGDTVYMSATAGEGYRFAGWSDNSKANPRAMIMNGGNCNLTARFETLGTDTMSYCGNLGQTNTWGESTYGADKYWGIKLPASSLTPGRSLTAVEFFAVEEGSYDVTVYSGTSAPTDVVYSSSIWISSSDLRDWYTFYLGSPYTIEAGKSLWITMHNSDVYYPAAISNSCGNPDGFLYGTSFLPDPEWNTFTFMLRGRFDAPGMIAQGDTLSYCGSKPMVDYWGVEEWGIMIPAAELAGRNYLKSVKMYSVGTGIYNLHVYKGGANAPCTLVHTQPANIDSYGWVEILLDNIVSINANDSLWITFSSPDVTWPAALCRYTGNANSNWFKLDYWQHASYSWGSYSWMIKVVTSATAPSLPAPTVAVMGDPYVGVGTAATYVAYHSTGTTVSWTIQDGSPSTYTGDTLTVSWSQTGRYQIIASVSNSHGVDTDAVWVNVVDCGQSVTEYPYYMGFERSDNMVCLSTLDADNDGQGWMIETSSNTGARCFFSGGSRWTENGQQTIAADNWFLLPKMTTRSGSGFSYNMTWYEMASEEEVDNAHYGVYIDTTCSANPSNYILLADYTIVSGIWYQPRTLDISAYAGKTFRLAFRHYNNGPNNIYIDDIVVDEHIPFFREGDTISYCGFRPIKGCLGYGSGNTYWGVRFPSSRLINCDTLKSVMLYVVSDGDYTLNIWQDGDDAPGTLLRSVNTTFNNQIGWQEVVLDPALPVDVDHPLWITFYSTAPYPAAFARNSGDENSDWISGNGAGWVHCSIYDYDASWMIKAVTSATPGCGGITLPYEADFTQCWRAMNGASIIDSTRVSINSPGQTLVSPWFEIPSATTIFFNHEAVRDTTTGEWWLPDNDVKIDVSVEDEYGVFYNFGEWLSYNHESWATSFRCNGGNIRFVFRYSDNMAAVPLLYLQNLRIYAYNINLSVEIPNVIRIGDTVNIVSHVTMEGDDTPDSRGMYIYREFDPWGEVDSTNCTILASTDSSKTVVWHMPGTYAVSASASKDSPDFVYADEWKNFTVYDTATLDCDNVSLPYAADFTQCWTTEGGAFILDPSHAYVTRQGQKLISPWMQTVPGTIYLVWSHQREGTIDCSYEWYTITVESEDDPGFLWQSTWCALDDSYTQQERFDSPGGRIRVTFEYTGIRPVMSFQIVDVMLYQYQIDVTVDAPGVVHVGDTVTFTAHATLQNGDTPDGCYWYIYDMNTGMYIANDETIQTIVSQNDSAFVVVWHTPGRYQVNNYVDKWNVYQGHGAYMGTSRYITVVDGSVYEEDSIYYTSTAKDTVIGCHQDLHCANLPGSVRVIDDYAFYRLANLSQVQLPDGLNHIGHRAFYKNSHITEITIPRGVQYMGDDAFSSNEALTTVNFNAVNCLVAGPVAGNGDYFPVFEDCMNLTTIHIGEEVTRIPDHLFEYTWSLRDTLVIPDQVTYIGESAFYSWTEGGPELTLVLGRSVSEIGNYAFPGTYGRVHHVISLNPVPPTLQPASFYTRSNYSLATVPCGSAGAYNSSPYWNEFIIEENCDDAIEDVASADDVVVYTVDGGIVVDGAMGESVVVYDMMGRVVVSTVNHGNIVGMPQTGVYMVRVGDRAARKVVLLR